MHPHPSPCKEHESVPETCMLKSLNILYFLLFKHYCCSNIIMFMFFINIVDNFWKDILRLIRKIHQFLADNTKKLLSFIFSPEFVISILTRVAVVHLNFRAWSTFPVPVCTVPPGHWVNKQTLIRTSRCNKADTVRL